MHRRPKDNQIAPFCCNQTALLKLLSKNLNAWCFMDILHPMKSQNGNIHIRFAYLNCKRALLHIGSTGPQLLQARARLLNASKYYGEVAMLPHLIYFKNMSCKKNQVSTNCLEIWVVLRCCSLRTSSSAMCRDEIPRQNTSLDIKRWCLLILLKNFMLQASLLLLIVWFLQTY